MSKLYLHHYWTSPFCEKIRLLCGYLGLEWHSVRTTTIMPRPLLTPLSGGYRKVPVAQIGADVYCDSSMIARAIAEYAGDKTLYAPGFAATRVADTANTDLFRLMTALSFRPEAFGSVFNHPDDRMGGGGKSGDGESGGGSAIERFIADRADLDGKGYFMKIKPEMAQSTLLHWLTELDSSVGSGFIFGDTPSIADFSVYHPLWFLRKNPYNAPIIEAYPNVLRWMDTLAAFGHGRIIESDGEAALAEARASEPQKVEPVVIGVDAKPGDPVSVTPTDYGQVSVEGELLTADPYEFAVRRTTDETGTIVTHFPRAGFELKQLASSNQESA
ncbi:MAG: glutathione S-transferase family protein [Gammaproteobacteria bacterium]|nr:glutathione S-transferase family protein [Gammaproteobacteria bacterium]